ncbi:MAG: Rab family GTPase [Candidatus Thorarchaeota archaeon]
MVLLGDSGVGKKEIRERYLGRGFQSKYMMTVGADFALKETVIDGRPVKFRIWDLAGQQRFNAVRSVYYLGALGGLLVFDVTRRESFERASVWIKELWTNNGKGIIPLVILGNNSDKRDSCPDSISRETALNYANKLSEQTRPLGFSVTYYDTNPKTGLNVSRAFEDIARLYFQYLEKQRKK